MSQILATVGGACNVYGSLTIVQVNTGKFSVQLFSAILLKYFSTLSKILSIESNEE